MTIYPLKDLLCQINIAFYEGYVIAKRESRLKYEKIIATEFILNLRAAWDGMRTVDKGNKMIHVDG